MVIGVGDTGGEAMLPLGVVGGEELIFRGAVRVL